MSIGERWAWARSDGSALTRAELQEALCEEFDYELPETRYLTKAELVELWEEANAEQDSWAEVEDQVRREIEGPS